MAIPVGPAGRPRARKPVAEPAQSTAVPVVAAVAERSTPAGFASQAHSLQAGRTPSEIIAREALSPAVIALSVQDFFELLYDDKVGPGHVTVEEFLRMRETGTWPELFTAGDPRVLFTEDLCRRGQFVPIAWHADGLSCATCKDDAAQDKLAAALDLVARLPITLYTVPADAVEAGVQWLYRRKL